jgi:hypothetical protein
MPPRKASARVERVWKRLAEWYGARLADQYGPTAPPDWALIIDRTDDERLETALIAVRRASPAWPPTLGQLESAIPTREIKGQPSLAEKLADHAVQKFGRVLCVHQVGKPWNYFGPMKEFVSKHRNNEVLTHPDIRGVQIPACEPCGTPAKRLLASEMLTP